MLHKKMRIVDAHAHVFEHLAGFGRRGELRAIGGGRARWIDGEEIMVIPNSWGDKSFSHDKLVEVLDKHGVSKAVLLQAPSYGFCNEYTFEAQQKHPGRLYGMGTFDPYAHESKRIMEWLIGDYRFRGLKFEVSRANGLMGYHPDLRLDGDMMTPIWEFAQREGFVVSLDLGTFGDPSLRVDALATIASRHPAVRFVVEHLFYPGRGHFDDLRSALSMLAPFENIFFTVAAIPNSTLPEQYPFPSACRYLGIAKEVIGADRILWGSDIPGVVVNASYEQLIDFVSESGLFSEQELQKVYAGNAIGVYGLNQ